MSMLGKCEYCHRDYIGDLWCVPDINGACNRCDPTADYCHNTKEKEEKVYSCLGCMYENECLGEYACLMKGE